MESEFGLRSTITDVMENMTAAVADLVPRAITAILVILVGLLIAKLAEKLVRTVFDRFKLNDLLERIGVSSNLQRIGLRGTPGLLLSRTIYFLLVILFTQSVTRAVGLNTIADAIGSFFSYLPNLAAAFLVILLGTMVAQFLARTITQSASDAGIEYAAILGRLVSGLVHFVVLIMGISQLQIDTDIIRSMVIVLLAGAALALALTFGLGTRDITRNLVAGFYARKLFQVGEEVEISGQRGILAGITPIQVLLDQDGRTVAIPNKVFLDEVVRQ